MDISPTAIAGLFVSNVVKVYRLLDWVIYIYLDTPLQEPVGMKTSFLKKGGGKPML